MFVPMKSRKLKTKQRWEVEEMIFALGSFDAQRLLRAERPGV